MKSFNIFSKLIALAIVFGMCFTSCQKDDALEKQTKKVTFGFNAQMPDNTNKKVDNPEDTDPYYGATSCDFSGLVGATVNVEYTIDGEPYKVNLKILNNPADDGFVATELIQVELEGDAETITSETLTVTKFNIQVGEDIVMAIPESGSAYDGYVDTPTSFEIVISEYDKKYVPLEVLCFQPDDYLEFGFTWFDFDIVEGEVISVFFNCINSEDREGYHEVLPARIKAYEGVYTENSVAYKDTATFKTGVPLSNYTPVNIEVPGLYKEFQKEEIENSNIDHSLDTVLTLGVTPNGYFKEILVPITKAEVDKYIDSPDGTWQKAEGAVRYDLSNDGTVDANDIYQYAFVYGKDKELENGEVINEKVIHYQFMDCYKADYYLADSDDTESVIYAVWPTTDIVENGVELVELFRIDSENPVSGSSIDVHLGLANNKRQLIVTNSSYSKNLYVYDIYSLDVKTYTFEESKYMFSELVYGKDKNGDYKLYATCKGSSNIKLIEFDINEEGQNLEFNYNEEKIYEFTPVYDEDGNEIMNTTLSGGDLVLDHQGRLICISANNGWFVVDDDLTDDIVEGARDLNKILNPETKNLGITGATMTADHNIITSSKNKNELMIWKWDGSTLSFDKSIDPTPLDILLFGDMASIYAGIQE